MNNLLINNLVDDLKPVAVIKNRTLWMYCVGCFTVSVMVVLSIIGIRPDYIDAMHSGAMFWKPILFALIGVGSILILTDISRPDGTVKRVHFAPMIIAGAIFVWQTTHQLMTVSFSVWVDSLYNSAAFHCLGSISILGAGIMATIWYGWLRRTASQNPAGLGVVSGMVAGTLAATAYGIHCNQDAISYIGVYYSLPILVLSAFGFFIGKRFLDW